MDLLRLRSDRERVVPLEGQLPDQLEPLPDALYARFDGFPVTDCEGGPRNRVLEEGDPVFLVDPQVLDAQSFRTIWR